MAFVNPYGRSNPLASFGEGVSTVAGLQQDAAKRQAGSALSRGDYTGAANPLLETGQLDAGVRVQEMGRKRQQDAASSMAASEKAVLDYTDQLIGNVGNVWKQYGSQDQSPDKAMARQRVLQAFDMGAGRLRELGETPDEIQEIRSSFEQDPEFTLAALGKAIEQKKLEIRNVGDEVLAIDPYTGQPVNRMRGARTVNIPEGGALYDIPGTGGMETPAAPTMATPPAQAPRRPLAGGPDLSMVDGLLEQTGGQVTSRTRTAERNAEVGGVGDSYHLTGQARDAIPPRGMNTAQYAATLKQNLPGWDVIDEGDHVHIEPGPAMGARKTPQGPYQVASMGETPRGNTTVSAAPQPPQETNGSPRLLVQRPKAPARESAPSGYRFNSQGSLEFIPGGPADPALTANKTSLRPIPSTALAGLTANRTTLSKIDRAIAAIQANPEAMGLANYMGDTIRQRIDGDGVPVRALVADIGSQKLHDRSGAAVTAAESPRLIPFIPQVTDSPAAAIQKLQNLKAEYAAAVDEAEAFYSPESGYRGVGAAPSTQATQPASGANPPRAAIDMLRQNPDLADQFDDKYGAGASDRFLKGR